MKKTPLRPSFVQTVAAAGVVASVASVGTVRADPPPRPAACPATPPTAGAACTTANLSCGYRACGDYWTVDAVCQASTRTWTVAESTCNPPMPTPVPQPTVNPPPPTMPAASGPPLRPGRRRCSFVEDGHRYDRQCIVTRQSNGSFRVVAPGTRLNPTNGFTLTITGTPPAYQVQGTLTAFGQCSGAVTGTTAIEGTGRAQMYKVRFRQCEIAITP